MTITELIKKLEEKRAKLGDIDAVVSDGYDTWEPDIEEGFDTRTGKSLLIFDVR